MRSIAHTPRAAFLTLLALSLLALPACRGRGTTADKPKTVAGSKTAPAAKSTPTKPTAITPPPTQPKQPPTRADTAAIIDGTPISRRGLDVRLAEATGAVVLEEAALDLLLDRELAAAQLTIASTAAQDERNLLVQSIIDESRVDAEQAERTITQLRYTRGLGPTRFNDLLIRNAKLRALAQARLAAAPIRSAPPASTTGESPEVIARRMKLREERVTMDTIARQLLNTANITIFDESLNWSWTSIRQSK